MGLLFQSFSGLLLTILHPFYVSMTDIAYNAGNRSLEISVRIFTDDFEGTLRKNYTGKVDLIHPQDKNRMNQEVSDYIVKHLQLQANGKPVPLSFVGYEQQEESTWCYFEAPNIGSVQQLKVTNSLLHDYNTNQLNMLHFKANGHEESSKLDYPNTEVTFP